MEGLKLPKAVLFDWDGTLVDTIPGLRMAHNHVRVSLGFPEWTEDQFWENLKHSARELYPSVYGERSEEALSILYEFVEKNHLDYLRELPDARKVLGFFSSHGIPCGLISNKRDMYLKREVSHLGWDDSFFAVMGAGIAAKDKPAPDPIHHMLGGMRNAPSVGDVWFIGDTETDLEAGSAAGCPTILVTHGRDKSGLIERFKPLIVVRDCGVLLEKLRLLVKSKLAVQRSID